MLVILHLSRKAPLGCAKTPKKQLLLNHFLNFSVAVTIVLLNQDLLFRVCMGPRFVIEICLILKPSKFLLIFCGLPIKAIRQPSAYLKLSNLFRLRTD